MAYFRQPLRSYILKRGWLVHSATLTTHSLDSAGAYLGRADCERRMERLLAEHRVSDGFFPTRGTHALRTRSSQKEVVFQSFGTHSRTRYVRLSWTMLIIMNVQFRWNTFTRHLYSPFVRPSGLSEPHAKCQHILFLVSQRVVEAALFVRQPD